MLKYNFLWYKIYSSWNSTILKTSKKKEMLYLLLLEYMFILGKMQNLEIIIQI